MTQQEPDQIAFLRIALLTKMQEYIEKKEWALLRIQFCYFLANFPSEAKEMWANMPDEIRRQLHEVGQGL